MDEKEIQRLARVTPEEYVTMHTNPLLAKQVQKRLSRAFRSSNTHESKQVALWASTILPIQGSCMWPLVAKLASELIELDDFLASIDSERASAIFGLDSLDVNECVVAERAIFWLKSHTEEKEMKDVTEVTKVLDKVRWSHICTRDLVKISKTADFESAQVSRVFPEFAKHLARSFIDPQRPCSVPANIAPLRNKKNLWHPHPGFTSKGFHTGIGVYCPIPNIPSFRVKVSPDEFVRIVVFNSEDGDIARRITSDRAAFINVKVQQGDEFGLIEGPDRQGAVLQHAFGDGPVWIAVFFGSEADTVSRHSREMVSGPSFSVRTSDLL